MFYKTGLNYYIQEIHPSCFRIAKLQKPKLHTSSRNAFNLDYFGGSPMYTVCNLAVDGKVIAETSTMKGSNTAGKKQTTLLVFSNGVVKMSLTDTLSNMKGLKYAIGGVPFMIDGKEVSLSKDIKTQGWSGGNFYKTWHSFLTIQNGMIWYIAANVGHSNDVKATTTIWKFLKSIGCTGTVIKLDGGGSFFFKRKGNIVKSTSENRTINYIGSWVDEDDMTITTTTLLLNGQEKQVLAINFDGNNYIKLRDLSSNSIKVDYDPKKNLPTINTK